MNGRTQSITLQYSTYSGISWILSSSDLTTWHFKDYFGHFERVDYLIASSENVALILLPTASVIPIFRGTILQNVVASLSTSLLGYSV